MNMSSNFSGAIDGLGIAKLVREGQVSALDVAKDAIRRIERVNPQLNAIAETVYEQGLETAARPINPDALFFGVPVVTKDLFQPLQGAQMTNGSPIGKGARMPFDAEIVSRAKSAGCTILATTTSPEFGTSFTTESRLFGATRNPWSLGHIAGGSSGGSAALVAARAIPFALGNDGGGSLRVPASCCGVFGFKPSRGRTPNGPAVGEGWAGMGINHVLSISVRDNAAALDAFAGEDIGAPYAAPRDDETFLSATAKRPKGLRVGLVTALSPWTTEPAVRAAIDETVKLLEDLGHHIEETELPVDALDYYDRCFNIIGAQTRSLLNFMGMMAGHPVDESMLEPRTRIILREKGDISGAQYAASVDYVHALGRRFGHLMQRYDVLLTPTLAKIPPRIGTLDHTDDDTLADVIETFHSLSPFTSLFNATGQPAMSVPLHWTNAGLPIGSHFAAGFGREALLFSLAAQLEEARAWAARIPPINALAGAP
jgi:amidase